MENQFYGFNSEVELIQAIAAWRKMEALARWYRIHGSDVKRDMANALLFQVDALDHDEAELGA